MFTKLLSANLSQSFIDVAPFDNFANPWSRTKPKFPPIKQSPDPSNTGGYCYIQS